MKRPYDMQRFVVGIEVDAVKDAEPQTPSIVGAEQYAVAPPLTPVHVHVQGLLPRTGVAVPKAQRLLVGATVVLDPLATSHSPFMGRAGAVHEAFIPPLEPSQFQVHGPVPKI
jgi:hypothetical protein